MLHNALFKVRFFFKFHGNPHPLHWNRNLKIVGSALLFFIIFIFCLSGFWVSFPPPQLPKTMLCSYNFRTAQCIYTIIRSKSNNLIEFLKDKTKYGPYTTFAVKNRIFNAIQGFCMRNLNLLHQSKQSLNYINSTLVNYK